MAPLNETFPTLPPSILWKTELLFRGVHFTEELAQASAEGAAPNYWPYRKHVADGRVEMVEVPYLFKLEGGAVARVRVDDRSPLSVRRENPGAPFQLFEHDRALCEVGFVKAHAWHKFRTSDGAGNHQAGVEQLGDMLVVNVTPGCEYFTERMRCAFCAYGRFSHISKALGQEPGHVAANPMALNRLSEVLRVAIDTGEAKHVYITGGSVLSVEQETERYVPIVETARRAVGDKLRVTCGSGAVNREGTLRLRDAGADSCCFNLETWDRATFEAVCPGKATFVGRDQWVQGLVDAVGVFGRGNVGSAFVAGVELRPPAPGMTPDQMVSSILEGASFMLDHGIMPLYSPLWPVEGTAYRPEDGLSPELYIRLEWEICRLRQARNFPVPSWLICPGCSYMLLEVDFDRAFRLSGV
jgi:hypothetical protein